MALLEENSLTDRFGRQAIDLRISLTDKCNLRCSYCMPAEGLPWLSKPELLTAAEIRRLIWVGVKQLGIREVRFTGGEPLLRHDLSTILSSVREDHPQLPLSLTTNAIGLAERADDLKAAGLDRINVSLDSLHPETFQRITRRPFLDRVLAGIDAALEAGLDPIKVNTVLIPGINDAQAPELVLWALNRGIELRFIEYMPLDADRSWDRTVLVSAAETRELLAEHFILEPVAARGSAPAERYQVRNPENSELLGSIGIIASVTEPFCAACTRTRITAEGKVMSCLFSHEEKDLRELLRSHASDQALADRWKEAMWAKPKAHGMDQPGLDSPDYQQAERTMSAIGG